MGTAKQVLNLVKTTLSKRDFLLTESKIAGSIL